MQTKLDKTVVLVAATRALTKSSLELYELTTMQRIVDILSSEKAGHIQSVILTDYEYELLEHYLEGV